MFQGSQHHHTGRKRTKDRDADMHATRLLSKDTDTYFYRKQKICTFIESERYAPLSKTKDTFLPISKIIWFDLFFFFSLLGTILCLNFLMSSYFATIFSSYSFSLSSYCFLFSSFLTLSCLFKVHCGVGVGVGVPIIAEIIQI